MRALRVGVDAWGLSGETAYSGMGQYVTSLLKWVPSFASVEMVAYGAPGEARPTWLRGDVEWRVPPQAQTGRLAAITSRTRWLPEAAAHDGIDVFHTPGLHVRPSSPPVPSVRCPHVVTVHDAIPLSFYGRALPARNKLFFSWNLKRAVRADRLLTVSKSARDEIARYAGVASGDIEVVTSAVDFAPDPYPNRDTSSGAGGAYLLYAGSYEPRKGLLCMLHAFDRFRRDGGTHTLVAVTERSSGHAADVHRALAALPSAGAVRLVHSVSDPELRALYSRAGAVVFPSLAEGLGLPPIQAAACGVPLVVSDLPVLRETVGSLARFARPGDPDSLGDALMEVTTDRFARKRAATLGPPIAAKYTPEACASDHARIYRSSHERRHALA